MTATPMQAALRAASGLLLLSLCSAPAFAEGEFASGSQVKGWKGLKGREAALFEARVTDVVCELTGDCPADCGAGERQLGLVRTADNVLLLAAKNAQAQFNGANHDLAAYCGQTVKVDGLLIGDPRVAATKVYQVHFVQPPGSSEWVKANRWTRAWKRLNPEVANNKGAWFRHDPGVKAELEANGRLGLGLEVDEKFIEERYR